VSPPTSISPSRTPVIEPIQENYYEESGSEEEEEEEDDDWWICMSCGAKVDNIDSLSHCPYWFLSTIFIYHITTIL